MFTLRDESVKNTVILYPFCEAIDEVKYKKIKLGITNFSAVFEENVQFAFRPEFYAGFNPGNEELFMFMKYEFESHIPRVLAKNGAFDNAKSTLMNLFEFGLKNTKIGDGYGARSRTSNHNEVTIDQI